MLQYGLLSLLATFAVAEFDIKVEYSLDDWATSHSLGSVSLHSIEGNYTGSFDLSADARSLGKKLFENRDSLYHIRSSSSGYPDRLVYSSTNPCLILRSRLMHELYVSIAPRSHSLLSLTLFPDPLALSDKECPEPDASAQPSAVVVVAAEAPLPSPDTQSYLEKIEREKRARQHGAENDNRSFIAKYWMYIVPVVIFVLISNAAGGQEGGE